MRLEEKAQDVLFGHAEITCLGMENSVCLPLGLVVPERAKTALTQEIQIVIVWNVVPSNRDEKMYYLRTHLPTIK